MTQLGVAVGHDAALVSLPGLLFGSESSSHWPAGAKASRLSREEPFTTVWLILTTPDNPTRFPVVDLIALE